MKGLPRGPLTLKFTEKATEEADGWAQDASSDACLAISHYLG